MKYIGATVISDPLYLTSPNALSSGVTCSGFLAYDNIFGEVVLADVAATLLQLGISANEILDWTADQGGTNIHAGNYTNTVPTLANVNALDITEVGTISSGTWNAGVIPEAKLQNQSGTNTGDETLSSINALEITEVGTISSGSWRGDVIASAYIADDAITEDKLSNTLLAEIDANTGRASAIVANTAKLTRHTLIDSDAFTGASSSNVASAESIKAYVDNTHATVQTGKNYRIINASFRDDIATDKHYVPMKSADENEQLLRAEQVAELAVCDGRLVSATVRVENMAGANDAFTLTMGVETNVVGVAYTDFTVIETKDIAANALDDHHIYHFVFGDASTKHWDSTDMFAISIQSDEDHWGTNERFFVTLVIEDDWSTYLGGTQQEIDSTP